MIINFGRKLYMPSFDIVSELDFHEVANAINQCQREIDNRFDFKGTDSKVEIKDNLVTVHSSNDFQLDQILQILRTKLSKRGINTLCMSIADPKPLGKQMVQEITLQHGIEQDIAKKIIQKIKDTKLKLQTQIQGEKLRVSGKKRDDLQDIIQKLKDTSLPLPLQFENFRD